MFLPSYATGPMLVDMGQIKSWDGTPNDAGHPTICSVAAEILYDERRLKAEAAKAEKVQRFYRKGYQKPTEQAAESRRRGQEAARAARIANRDAAARPKAA